MKRKVYFHGGVPGLKCGDLILPTIETGVSSLYHLRHENYNGQFQRNDRVFVTTVYDLACVFAGSFKDGLGFVYEVEPELPIESDPTCAIPDISFQCPRAKVIKVRADLNRDNDAATRGMFFSQRNPLK
jgi:rifampin ADP-ribosylating transferase